jgi:hypothetical protein
MDCSPDDYLAANAAYPGVEQALMFCEFPYYIASSKRAGRVSKLATDLLKLRGFEEGSPRMMAGLQPPAEAKAGALGCARLHDGHGAVPQFLLAVHGAKSRRRPRWPCCQDFRDSWHAVPTGWDAPAKHTNAGTRSLALQVAGL